MGTLKKYQIKKKINDYFFVLKNEDIMNNEIYFLADNSIFNDFDKQKN